MRNFSHFVSKALFDPKFAEDLQHDPEQALRDIGIEPTDKILNALEDIDLDKISNLAEAFDAKGAGMP